jgi:hypothetical protein
MYKTNRTYCVLPSEDNVTVSQGESWCECEQSFQLTILEFKPNGGWVTICYTDKKVQVYEVVRSSICNWKS